MGLTDNLKVLSGYFPGIISSIENAEQFAYEKKARLESTRNGMYTIAYESAAGLVYLHSKYDPLVEAQRFISQFQEAGRYKHVFFYGVGMGYHVVEFLRNWPDMKFVLYEPDRDILLQCLSEIKLESLPMANCQGIYIGNTKEVVANMLQQYMSKLSGEVLFIVLPSYERVFAESYRTFMEDFRTAVVNKRASLQAQTMFQKIWTINSIRNFKEVIYSPNMLQDKKRYFTGKPAIIAAAGPSLSEELEKLRYIKDNKLAYIFSVGSAINTLIDGGVCPDAVCIYDPAPNTAVVVKKVKEQGLKIPIIFGSTVYPEALQGYPGMKLHMPTSQDTILPFFLKPENNEALKVIIDSPSIAIITLQMLVMLECSPIILIGQNFAFKNDRYYAQGIEYKSRSGQLNNVDVDNSFEVEDVHGGTVKTSKLFNHMRNQMEMYIDYCGRKDIINSTSGGARIKGTEYRPLEELSGRELTGNAVDFSWFEDYEASYDMDNMINMGRLMSGERDHAKVLIAELVCTAGILGTESNAKILQQALSSFENAYNKLVKNGFFNHVLKPMNRVQFEMISKNIPELAVAKDTIGKARLVSKIFSDVFECCEKDMHSIRYDFDDMLEEIQKNDIKVMTFTIKAS